jgi:hypothetical protein
MTGITEARANALERAAVRLAERLADAATIAPGGSRWPRYELPREHKCYAVLGWLGENVLGGGQTPREAKRALAAKLLEVAGEEWQTEAGESFRLLDDILYRDGQGEAN